MNPFLTSLRQKAAPLVILGAFFLSGCKEKPGTSSWHNAEIPVAVTEAAPPATDSAPAPAPAGKPITESGKPVAEAAPPLKTDGVRFMAYNLKNYLEMPRGRGDARGDLPKPEEEIEALLKVILSEKPDILGICEIGSEKDLADLRTRLQNAGLDLPHTHHTGGWDNTRHLAILSRFPLLETDSQGELTYSAEGSTLTFSRGILDATIDPGSGPIRFIGLHLKSKREIPNHDQELMRQNEALLARKHCDKIFDQNPDAKIIVYGDFNDTIKSPTLANLRGNGNSNKHLDDIPLLDSRGHSWTHSWDYQDVYSRFDYVLASAAAEPLIDRKASHLVDIPESDLASDHRALFVLLKSE